MEKREEVDWRRHGVFCTFGLFYLVRVDESLGREREEEGARMRGFALCAFGVVGLAE
jgi:hypothetical protein